MRKYLVKKTLTAKENHPWCPGDVQVYVYGTGEKSVPIEWINTRWFKEMGWGRKHFAQHFIDKDIAFYNTHDLRYWDMSYEIMEVEI